MDNREVTNQNLFSQTKPVEPQAHLPSLPIEIPGESVVLPSQGLLYPADHPFHGLNLVDIKAMTAKDEDILTSAALVKKGTVIKELLRSCILDKRVNPSSLVSGDQNALLVAIRVTGYGAEYDGEVKCGECEATTKRQFNLGSLGIKRLGIEPVETGKNLFEFKLPKSGAVVRFSFMTVGKQEEISEQQEVQKKKLGMQNDTLVTTTLFHCIQSVDGEMNRLAIQKFIETMSARDSRALREFMQKNEPGVDMKQESKCPACGAVEEVTLPMGPQFLWPRS